MTTSPSAPRTTATPWSESPALAGFLSFLVPGLGQIVQGRVAKGVMFMVVLLSMFVGGQALGGWKNVYIPRNTKPLPANPVQPITNIINQRWHYAGQLWIGVAAAPAIYQYFRWPDEHQFEKAAQGNDLEPTGFWNTFQSAPSESSLNDFLRSSDKSPELGWVYTVIAGMLNILVIYDAIAGPAHGLGKESKT